MHLLIQVRTIYRSDVLPILNFVDEPPSLTFLPNISTDLGLAYPVLSLLAATLLLIAAIISASESAFFSISRDQLESFRKSPRDQNIVFLLDHRDIVKVIMTLSNSIVKIGLVTISALILFHESQTHIPSGFAFGFLILIIALCGDLIPRIYGKRYAPYFVRLTSGPWRVLVMVFKSTIGLVYLRAGTSRKTIEQGIMPDELDGALGTDKKGTTDVEKEILIGIANFSKLTVSQVMHSRFEISAIDASFNFTMLMECVNKCGFSRIPVYRDTLDTIEGILYIKDLLPFLDYPQGFQWQSLVRPGLFVRDSIKIEALLKDFQEKRVHMAVVVDDLGKTIGLVTLEDLLEEIIGEIKDEFDNANLVTRNKHDKTIVFESKTSIQDGTI